MDFRLFVFLFSGKKCFLKIYTWKYSITGLIRSSLYDSTLFIFMYLENKPNERAERKEEEMKDVHRRISV